MDVRPRHRGSSPRTVHGEGPARYPLTWTSPRKYIDSGTWAVFSYILSNPTREDAACFDNAHWGHTFAATPPVGLEHIAKKFPRTAFWFLLLQPLLPTIAM